MATDEKNFAIIGATHSEQLQAKIQAGFPEIEFECRNRAVVHHFGRPAVNIGSGSWLNLEMQVPSRGEPSRTVNLPEIVAGPPPVHPSSSQDHNFLLQIALQTERSIDELKTGLEAVSKSSEKQGSRIESLNETVQTARGVLKAIAWMGESSAPSA